MTTTEYLTSLKALSTLGTPLVVIPNGVSTTIGLQCALQDLTVALLKVEVEIMRQHLEEIDE